MYMYVVQNQEFCPLECTPPSLLNGSPPTHANAWFQAGPIIPHTKYSPYKILTHCRHLIQQVQHLTMFLWCPGYRVSLPLVERNGPLLIQVTHQTSHIH